MIWRVLASVLVVSDQGRRQIAAKLTEPERLRQERLVFRQALLEGIPRVAISFISVDHHGPEE